MTTMNNIMYGKQLVFNKITYNRMESLINFANTNFTSLFMMNIRDVRIPDLTKFKLLTSLKIESCDFDEENFKSIGLLTSLVNLKLVSLPRINKLPTELSNLHNLENLIIEDILLDEIPKSFSNLNKLDALTINNTNIKTIPIFPNLLNLNITVISNVKIANIFSVENIFKNQSIIELKLYGINSFYIFNQLWENIDKLNKDIKIYYNNVIYIIENNNMVMNPPTLGHVNCLIQTWSTPIYISHKNFLNIYKYYNIEGVNNRTQEEMCKTIEKYSPSKIWYNSIKKYYNSLNQKQINTLLDYTHNGDRIINTFYRNGLIYEISKFRDEYKSEVIFKDIILKLLLELRDKDILTINGNTIISLMMENRKITYNLNTNREIIDNLIKLAKSRDESTTFFDFISDFFLGQIIVLAAKTITDIFINIPPLDKEILVFRGVKSNLFIKDKTIFSEGILSTSFSPLVAENFIDFEEYIKVIYVDKGTRCIPLFLSKYFENEVIFPHGSKLTLYDCRIEKNSYGNNINLCEIELRENIVEIDPIKFLNVKNWT